MTSENIHRIKLISTALAELNQKVTFVGGAVAELYVDDPISTDIRVTKDVDCVVKLESYGSLYEFEKHLRRLGFANDTSNNAPICRWVYNDECVDIMPDDPSILGFSNKWYSRAIEHRKSVTLDEGLSIFIFPVTYYLATKIEAVSSRGGNDWRVSHDFEDIIYILSYCTSIISDFDCEKDSQLIEFLSKWATQTLIRPNIMEEIECALPYGESDRIQDIIDILRHFARTKT